MQPGMLMASVAMANGINANMLSRWVQAAERRTDAALAAPKCPAAQAAAAFVPLQLPAKAVATNIRIELRRCATAVAVT